MTNQNTQPQAGGEPAIPSDAPETTPAATGDASTLEWATKELKRAREEAAKYRTERNSLKQQIEAEKKRQLEESGRFQELYQQANTELETLKSQVESGNAYKPAFEALLQSRINQIPEANRALIPTDYEPIKLSAWLDANWERLGPRRAPNLDAGAGGPSGSSGGGGAGVSPQAMELGKRLGLKPEDIAEVYKGK